jgi:hypothetical protein
MGFTMKTMFGLLTGILLILVFTGCGLWGDEIMPRGVFGIWETDDAKYRDCYLELDGHSLIFYNSESDIDVGFIKKTEITRESDRLLIEITYSDKLRHEFFLPIFFSETADGPVIRFKNQPEIKWVKREKPVDF